MLLAAGIIACSLKRLRREEGLTFLFTRAATPGAHTGTGCGGCFWGRVTPSRCGSRQQHRPDADLPYPSAAKAMWSRKA